MAATSRPEPRPPRKDEYAKYTIQNIRRGKKEQGRDHIIYASLYDETGSLVIYDEVISATLDYITEKLQKELL